MNTFAKNYAIRRGLTMEWCGSDEGLALSRDMVDPGGEILVVTMCSEGDVGVDESWFEIRSYKDADGGIVFKYEGDTIGANELGLAAAIFQAVARYSDPSAE